MHAKKLTLLSLLLLTCLSGVQAKKPKLLEGNFDSLRHIRRMNVQFNYSAQTIGSEEIPDATYIKDHSERVNEKTPGKGTIWAAAWVNNRVRVFEPAFKNAFHNASKVMLTNAMPQKYTLMFKTLNLEPGYNVGISRKNAKLTGEAWIVETANPDHVLCKLQVTDVPGGGMGGFDFDNGTRMKMSYLTAGNMLGKYVKKKV